MAHEYTVDELALRFLQITRKLELVVNEKNWAMTSHFLLERNDVIELLEPFADRKSEAAVQHLQEAAVLQQKISQQMQEYHEELARIISHSARVQKVNRKYQEQFITGNILHGLPNS